MQHIFKLMGILSVSLFLGGACVSSPGSTDIGAENNALMASFPSSDAYEMADADSCSCPAIRCEGKTVAAACSVSCENPKEAVCLCGKCSYGAFNRCQCN